MFKHFDTLKKPVNVIFLVQIVVVFLVAFGVWPRTLIIPLTALIAIFILRADLETSASFFIRSIPLFVAIPFTSYFDSFNIWRIAGGLIFLKWFYQSYKERIRIAGKSAIHLLENSRGDSMGGLKHRPPETSPDSDSRGSRVGGMADLLVIKIKKYPLASLLTTFLLLSTLSLLAAEDIFTGIKRIIYLINLSLVPLVVYDLIKKKPALIKKFLDSILISGVIVAGVGITQLVSAYLMPLGAFLDFWGGTVQLGFYGSQWSSIALEGNTWFAYFGDQLSLRIFSTFTDSHSFPVYLLMTIPALLALAKLTWKRGFQVSGIVLLVLYLLIILSGTRGIWLAVLGPLLAWPVLVNFLKRDGGSLEKSLLKKLGLLLLPFFLLFAAAFPIMGSDQFWVEKENNQILAKRIRSVLDLNETSNSGRVEIWKKTVKSIIHRPLLGVGIGNFPTVLSQHTDLAKAGSSAHNLYLHIAAEIGLVGLLAALGILFIILKRSWDVFRRANQPHPHSKIPERGVGGREWVGVADWLTIKTYAAAFVLYSLWVLFYSLTDAIMFDERVFLVFAINSAVILGLYKTKSALAD
ncbi:MAG: putative membrane protein of ExoQ family [Parcubacteria group bacterium Gr01-1014_44]|nr:MAG: putative membrane protein of ExoQ family [Parcubacteria group bacterium Gr01-1014_44]